MIDGATHIQYTAHVFMPRHISSFQHIIAAHALRHNTTPLRDAVGETSGRRRRPHVE